MKIRVLCTRITVGLMLAGCQLSTPPCTTAPTVAPPPPRALVTAEYLLMDYGQGFQSLPPPDLEIKPTTKYESVRSRLKSAAIRVPDACLEEAGAKNTTASNNTQTILKTTCGPWLSEIEKTLAAAGYQVFSWDAIQKAQSKGKSTYDAAKELGADVVFIFNTLDASDIQGGSESEGRFRYFTSNSRGEAISPQPLDETTRTQLKGFAVQAMGTPDAHRVIALQSNIDATAVLPETGESIWFYRRAVMFPIAKKQGMKFLFGRLPGQPWTAVSPDVAVQSSVVMPPQLSSEDTVRGEVGAQLDPYRKERNALIEEGAREFVKSFQGGTK